jgi:DNA gyrase subunit B
MKALMGFVPRKYDAAVVEAMALAGALDPELSPERRRDALERAAAQHQLGDAEAAWNATLGADGTITFAREWRGVTDAHLVEAGFVGSAEARKLHRLAQEQAEAYAFPARLTRGSTEPEPEPEPVVDEAEPAEGEPQPAVAKVDGAITRPSQLLEAVLATGRKGLAISRYKGLGEMNAEQLWETTLDPDNRVLLQVKVEDADVTDEIFTRLMGDVVEPRRDFIQENALNVANLDV